MGTGGHSSPPGRPQPWTEPWGCSRDTAGVTQARGPGTRTAVPPEAHATESAPGLQALVSPAVKPGPTSWLLLRLPNRRGEDLKSWIESGGQRCGPTLGTGPPECLCPRGGGRVPLAEWVGGRSGCKTTMQRRPLLPPAREARCPKNLLWAGWPHGPAPQTRPGRRRCGLPSSPDHSLAWLTLLTSGNTDPGERGGVARRAAAAGSGYAASAHSRRPWAAGSEGGRGEGPQPACLQRSLPLLPLGAAPAQHGLSQQIPGTWRGQEGRDPSQPTGRAVAKSRAVGPVWPMSRVRVPTSLSGGSATPRCWACSEGRQWFLFGRCPESPPSLSRGSATTRCSVCSEGLRLGAPGSTQCLPAGRGPPWLFLPHPHCSHDQPGATSSLAGSPGPESKAFSLPANP